MAFWAFRGVSFCSLRLFEPSGGYPSQLRASDRGGPPTSCQKRSVSPRPHTKNLSAPWPSRFSNFWACGRQFSSFWLCAPSFPFVLPFWAFILASRPPFGLWGVPFATSGLEGGGILWLFFWPFGPLGGVSFCSLRLFGPSGGILLLFVAFTRRPVEICHRPLRNEYF